MFVCLMRLFVCCMSCIDDDDCCDTALECTVALEQVVIVLRTQNRAWMCQELLSELRRAKERNARGNEV